ncbi:MAG: ATP-binding protein [Kofleriaceae bacterium]
MSGEPYASVGDHLRDELRRAWLRIEYQVRLGWTRSRTERGEDLAEVAPDLGRLFAAARGESPIGDDAAGASVALEAWLAAHRATEARIRATIERDQRSPFVDLIRVFALTPRQWATLMFALLPEADPNLVQAYRHLTRDTACRSLDGRLLAQLVYDTPESRSLMARDLSPNSPLLRYRLLDVSATTSHESLLFRKIRAATRLIYMLDGASLELDPDLAELAELRGGPATGTFPGVVVERARAAIHSNEVIVAVQGQRGTGKRLLLQAAAAHWSKRLLLIDSRRLSQAPIPAIPHLVRSLVRELRLLDAVPGFIELDDAIVRDGDRDELPGWFDGFLAEWTGPVALTINRERMPRIHQRPIVHLLLEVPTLTVRTAMWRDVMPGLPMTDAESLAGRFAIPGGVIVAASQAATAGRMPDAGPPTGDDLATAVAEQLHQRLVRLGKRLPTPFEIEDLVVDDDTRSGLLEIAAAARERRRIRDAFQLRGAPGISVLFSGHPGVGKTMSATVLANRLGLDIYEIDLSQVVSKWLGETEKNLGDVFDAAEPGHVVLLFNEADSLFGKRTSDVKSSNDRYANMETNYLLQRLERFGGLAILTTNLTSAIDQAFKRRFTYDVFLGFPTPEMRAELWRRTLTMHARAASIDFESLAENYELSGGFIKVACERATYIAGANNIEIDTALLRGTIERMYRERGKVSAGGRLE